jgi:hypothetical protein
MGIAAAQNAAAGAKPGNHRHRALTVIVGISLGVAIGGGLFILAALYS